MVRVKVGRDMGERPISSDESWGSVQLCRSPALINQLQQYLALSVVLAHDDSKRYI